MGLNRDQSQPRNQRLPMTPSLRLLARRRFLPLFATQFLGAFNDNLFKQAMVLFATYSIYSNAKYEASFSAIATGLFILPFFLLSALSGQLADRLDKALIVRTVKSAEIVIMLLGATGLLLASVPLMLGAVLAMGIHSTFFGPIKYAILPQHLKKDEVLGGTGLIEAGTYIAILAGTILAGVIDARLTAAIVLGIAAIGWLTARGIPVAPPPRRAAAARFPRRARLDPARVGHDAHSAPVPGDLRDQLLLDDRIGADHRIPAAGEECLHRRPAGREPVPRDLLGRRRDRIGADQPAARWERVGALRAGLGDGDGRVRAADGVRRAGWEVAPTSDLYSWREFAAQPNAWLVAAALLGVSVTGGMFVVPLYAFLTTTVERDHTARTVAANNIVNSGAMVVGAIGAMALAAVGVSVVNALASVALLCMGAALLAWKLHRACDGVVCA